MVEPSSCDTQRAGLRVTILAMGTRGDVQPLAVLAARLSSVYPTGGLGRVALCTHHAHSSWLLPLLEACTPPGSVAPEFHPTASPPHAPVGSREEGLEGCLRPMDHYDTCIEASRGSTLIIINLFALEGYHIAEALQVALAVCQPYPCLSRPPPSLLLSFRLTHPQLYHTLTQQNSGDPGPGLWDVQHWMWPLFADHWDTLRDRLGLEGVPRLPCRAVPVLYLYSPLVLPPPPHYPGHVHVLGFVTPRTGLPSPPVAPFTQLPPFSPHEPTALDGRPAELERFLSCEEGGGEGGQWAMGPVYVTFGTMVGLGALGEDLKQAARTVVQGVRGAGLRGVLGAEEGSGWGEAVRAVVEEEGRGQVMLVSGSVDHNWLLPKCCCVVHHGGSGTTAAALLAGIAQVCVPMMLDQHLWADRVHALHLGPAPLCPSSLLPSAPCPSPAPLLSAALTQAVSVPTRLRAAALGRTLRQEQSSEPHPLAQVATVLHSYTQDLATSGHAVLSEAGEGGRGGPLYPPPVSPPPLPEGLCVLCVEQQTPPACDRGRGQGQGQEERGGGEAGGTQERGEGGPITSDRDAIASLVDKAREEEAGEEEGGEEGQGGGGGYSLELACVEGSEVDVQFLLNEHLPVSCYLPPPITLHRGEAVLDVGANIGLFTLHVALLLGQENGKEEGQGIRVIAIEPAPLTYQALLWNLQHYHLTPPSVKPINAGVGDGSAAHRMLRFYPRLPGSSSMEEGEEGIQVGRGVREEMRQRLVQGAEEVQVPMVTVEEVIEREVEGGVGLLKVDVEGAELSALRGVGRLWGRVRQVVIEVHPRGSEGRAPREEVERVLRDEGGFGKVWWVREEWAEQAGVDNWLVFAVR